MKILKVRYCPLFILQFSFLKFFHSVYRAISHLRSNSCNEDVTKGISCFHDPEYEIQPDLASDLYESKYYWESKDCRAFTSVENPDKVHFICDNPKWTKVDGSQVVSCLISQQWQIPIKMEYFKFPDEIFYLRINGTNIRHLKKVRKSATFLHFTRWLQSFFSLRAPLRGKKLKNWNCWIIQLKH